MLPLLTNILPALNNAILISSATLEGATIKCSTGNLFGTKFRGLNLAICASGSLGIHIYGSDMEIEIKYLKKHVTVSAPNLDASATSKCKAVMKATVVTAATTVLLTGEANSDSSRSFDYGPNITLSTTSCSCMSTPRPCLFIHGLGINYTKANLHDSFSSYWGDVSDHAPCCTEFKYMIWNSVETGWNNEKQQQIMCDLATSLTESSSRTDIADTIIVTHSMGGLLLAGGEMSSTKLNEDFKAAQKVYRSQVYAAMCSNWYVGLFFQRFKSGGLPLDQFSNHYSSRFYVTHLNHADTTFYNGDGLFNSAKMPVKWFECVL
ncbi:unnamed protein product [Peronospora effusa]|nr:unnamed protein product [Peronospora effusa]